MSAIIEAKALSRWYGIVLGLNNVSFEVQPGITGLVGPNGAGKSTLIQIITGQLRPSSGMLTVFGQRPWNNVDILRRLGFCPEKEAMHTDLRPVDWLMAMGRISGLPAEGLREHAEATLVRVKLAKESWNRRIGTYSKGMRQRVKLAQALLHDPDLLVLDEPMNGLDPMGRQEIATILREFAAQGKSIIISSHILHELETLCRQVLILNWGRIIATGSHRRIRQDQKNWAEQLLVRCSDRTQLIRLLFDAGLIQGFQYDHVGDGVAFQLSDPERFFKEWNRILLESGLEFHEIRSENRSLQQVFEKVIT